MTPLRQRILAQLATYPSGAPGPALSELKTAVAVDGLDNADWLEMLLLMIRSGQIRQSRRPDSDGHPWHYAITPAGVKALEGARRG